MGSNEVAGVQLKTKCIVIATYHKMSNTAFDCEPV